jgi:uncharacterized membrane protein HdeD (DUF308 family)
MIHAMVNAWRSVVLRGIIVTVLGIAALVFPAQTTWIVGAFALYAILHGVVDIVVALRTPGRPTHAGAVFIEGAVWIAGGLATYHWLFSAFTLGFVIAFWALGLGVVALILAVVTHAHLPHVWLLGALGVAAIAFGGWLLHEPEHLFLIGPSVEIAALAFLSGTSMLIFGLQGRHVQKQALANPDVLMSLKR